MQSVVGKVRNVIFKKSGSLSTTLTIKRDISEVVFKNNDTYKDHGQKRISAANTIVAFGKISGLDAAGAETAEIPGGFHSGGKGVDKFSRVTALIRDGDKNQLYFYRTTDKTFWDRVHIPESDSGTDWPSTPMYIGITKGDFDAKKPPE